MYSTSLSLIFSIFYVNTDHLRWKKWMRSILASCYPAPPTMFLIQTQERINWLGLNVQLLHSHINVLLTQSLYFAILQLQEDFTSNLQMPACLAPNQNYMWRHWQLNNWTFCSANKIIAWTQRTLLLAFTARLIIHKFDCWGRARGEAWSWLLSAGLQIPPGGRQLQVHQKLQQPFILWTKV